MEGSVCAWRGCATNHARFNCAHVYLRRLDQIGAPDKGRVAFSSTERRARLVQGKER
jgi:hypothetical protein